MSIVILQYFNHGCTRIGNQSIQTAGGICRFHIALAKMLSTKRKARNRVAVMKGNRLPLRPSTLLGVIKHMRITAVLFFSCVGLLVGCAHPHFSTGHGDAGQFMLQRAIDYGARPITTNGLPVLDGDWEYIEDKYGVGLLFSVSRYREVESFLTSAFGPRSGSPGWAVRDIGAAIYLQRQDTNTVVGIHPPNLGVKN